MLTLPAASPERCSVQAGSIVLTSSSDLVTGSFLLSLQRKEEVGLELRSEAKKEKRVAESPGTWGRQSPSSAVDGPPDLRQFMTHPHLGFFLEVTRRLANSS